MVIQAMMPKRISGLGKRSGCDLYHCEFKEFATFN